VTEIDEGLIGGEQIVLRTNKHWFAPVADSGIAVLMLLGVILLAWIEPAQPTGLFTFVWRLVDLIQLGLFLGAIGWIVYNIVAWRTAEYAVTPLRVRGHEGLIKKRSTDSLLTSISDVMSRSGLIGRTLGFGNIKILTASGDAGDDTFTSMKAPDTFKKAVIEQKAGAQGLASAAPAQPAAPAPAPPHPPGSKDAMSTLTELAKLRDAGAITPAEYESKKSELLARI
jgi:membrane protein YdbS with pleckstrin-like domain